jgi:hypothetical protein
MNGFQGLRITERDLILIRDIYENLQLSFEQIRSRHFQGLSRVTVQNRLSQLLSYGYLRKLRLSFPIAIPASGTCTTVYTLRRASLNILRERSDRMDVGSALVRIGGKDLRHDLILTEVRTAMMRRFPGQLIRNGKLMPKSQMKNAKVPDLVVSMPGSQKLIAIELELTPKSRKRYRQIILQYRMNAGYERIIYVACNQSLKNLLESQIHGRMVPGIQKHGMPSKFEVTELSDLLAQPQEDTAHISREVC